MADSKLRSEGKGRTGTNAGPSPLSQGGPKRECLYESTCRADSIALQLAA